MSESGESAESIALELEGDDVDADGPAPDADGLDDGPDVDGDDAAPGADGNDGGATVNKPFSVGDLKARLKSTEPNLDLDDPSLDDVVDTENGGLARVKRGVYKLVGLEGATAAEDLIRGGLEYALQQQDGKPDGGDGDGDGNDDGNDDGGKFGGDGVPDL